jgi:sterol desaturase/sphingolipid hydroxylase (fatty acid hydroxylase superfamily)
MESKDRPDGEQRGMIYSVWLFSLSLLFVVLERLWPRRRQRLMRRGIGADLAYLIFNSEYLGVLIGAVSIYTIAWLDRILDLAKLREGFYLGAMSGSSVIVQFVVLLFVFDFVQWGIHYLLHRVPFLWRIHRVHHSIEEMDWIGNWRFHGLEVAIYRIVLYPLAAFFGFGVEAFFAYGVVNTFIGHFAHSNLKVRIGFLKYLVNSPEMHVWHHAHPEAGPQNRNFGIALSVWDWLLGTAYLSPGPAPVRLGCRDMEAFPHNVVVQTLSPFNWRE